MKTIEGITLDWLYERVKEQDGCLLWVGSVSKSNQPKVQIGGKSMYMRRVMWQWKFKMEVPNKRRISPKCGNPTCVNPDHLVAMPINQINKGKPHSLMRRAAVAEAQRARSRFTDEVIAQVRESNDSLKSIADQAGMCYSYVCRIRNGTSRKDFSNPYLQLVSRK